MFEDFRTYVTERLSVVHDMAFSMLLNQYKKVNPSSIMRDEYGSITYINDPEFITLISILSPKGLFH